LGPFKKLFRPPEENQLLGFIDDGQNPGVSKDEDWKSYDDVKNEVLYFKSQCHQCGGHAETRMKPTGVFYSTTSELTSLTF
jgi:hypothetical protein